MSSESEVNALYDEYFRVVRATVLPLVASNGGVVELDSVMQKLLGCSQRYSTKARYREFIQGALIELSRIEKLALLGGPVSGQSASVEPNLLIEVLLAVIHQPDEGPDGLAAAVARQGRTVSREQIEAVFARYGLGKKKGGWKHSPP